MTEEWIDYEGKFRFRKHTIRELNHAQCPKYAVFKRSLSGRQAQFRYLHETLESAIDKCREYAALSVASGKTDFTFYAVEIKHRVGIENGQVVDQPIVK